jgi:hypothetical protein
MKNIHILPTDKPSRLHLWTDENGSRLELCDLEYSHTRNTQHIYITSDEKIKDGEWFYNPFINDIQVNCNSDGCKKLILTTDTDLIADGVQAIDDEFLEWFVRNPNCEKFEVISMPRCCGRCDGVDDLCFTDMCCNDHQEYGCEICYGKRSQYKIIVPKEEPKFGDSFENLANVMSTANFMFGVKEEPKQEYQSECICDKECRGFVNVKCKKTNQETLEDAAENYVIDEAYLPVYKEECQRAFINGAKWQAERMYSEEEVKFIISEALQSALVTVNLDGWFNQFKK